MRLIRLPYSLRDATPERILEAQYTAQAAHRRKLRRSTVFLWVLVGLLALWQLSFSAFAGMTFSFLGVGMLALLPTAFTIICIRPDWMYRIVVEQALSELTPQQRELRDRYMHALRYPRQAESAEFADLVRSPQ